MLIAILILLLITAGGTVLTYLYEKEDSLLVRVCAGNVIGSIVFGLAAFLLACFFYLQVWVVLVSLAIALLPLLLLTRKNIRETFLRDWRKAEGKLEGTTARRMLGLAYYSFIFIMLFLFFDRAMIEAKDGIYTGVAHNLGDLHFHLDAIYSFTDGQNFPPENPSYAGAKFTYPFMADLVSACMVALGASARRAMFWQNLMLGFSLVVLLENFTFRLTRNKLAGRMAPLLLFFSGGLGFLLFFRDFFYGTQDFFNFIWHLPKDYTIRFDGGLRWGNSLITLFATQRSLLLGMPLTLISLTCIWKLFDGEAKDEQEKSLLAPVIVGLLTGLLPLVHAHSLMVVFFVAAVAAIFTIEKWKRWLAFAIGTAVTAVPELIWALSGSASQTGKFIEWYFGWDSGEWNIFVFWLLNTGLFIPLLVTVVLFMIFSLREKTGKGAAFTFENAQKLLIFYVPFAFFFILCNVTKLAPWQWDNIKVLIYWFVGSIPLVALLLAKVWERGKWYRYLAAGMFAVLIFAGALDVWRVISAADAYQIADTNAIKIADDIKKLTEPRALFLNAPTFNSAVGLSGRRSLMRYSGHLSSYGIPYEEREADVKRIYSGLAASELLMRKYNIEYVLMGPEERKDLRANEQFFSRFPLIAEEGPYRVYKIKK
jgi:hypothetical protein